MRYAIIKISEAEKNGISSDNHLVHNDAMIVSEKEIANSNIVGNSFEDKIDRMGGKSYSNFDIKIKIKKDGYRL